MSQKRYPAVFMRGGTSKGVFFRYDDLPADRAERDAIFLAALGSPDSYGRQLNGMGGGVSSVSKAVVVGPPTVADTDVDYTFAQIAIDEPVVDYATTCGNLSSAIGPFAVDNDMAAGTDNGDGTATVRVHNTNTSKIYHATFEVRDGRFHEAGDFVIPGVSGVGSRIRLDYLDPGGATTGKLLPTGNPLDTLSVPGEGDVEISMVDAATGCAFVAAERFGLTGAETYAEIEADRDLMARFDRVRRVAAVAMGLAEMPDAAALANPRIGLLAPPRPYTTLSGEQVDPASADIAARILSMGQVHRVLPLTGAMCLGVACRIPGTLANAIAGQAPQGTDLRLANPSGVLPVDARVQVSGADGEPRAETVTVYRTARALMEGAVLVPM